MSTLTTKIIKMNLDKNSGDKTYRWFLYTIETWSRAKNIKRLIFFLVVYVKCLNSILICCFWKKHRKKQKYMLPSDKLLKTQSVQGTEDPFIDWASFRCRGVATVCVCQHQKSHRRCNVLSQPPRIYLQYWILDGDAFCWKNNSHISESFHV